MAAEKQPAYAPGLAGDAPPAYPGTAPSYMQPLSAPPGVDDQFTPIHPQQGMPPPAYYQGQPIAVQPVQQVFIVQQHMFRDAPVNTVCPHCSHHIITATTAEAGGMTWLLCVLLAVFGLWLGCCLIPFCVDGCQDIRHSCPNCKKTIHVFRRM